MDRDTQQLVVQLRTVQDPNIAGQCTRYVLASLCERAADLIEKQAGILYHIRDADRMLAEADWEREQLSTGEQSEILDRHLREG